MKVVLADITSHDGFVNKDTIVGGYGARLRGRSWTTRMVERLRKRLQNLPSVQLGYLAAIFAQAGHEVIFTDGEVVEGDLALVLTSIVDHRNEIRWVQEAKKKYGMQVGFIGTFATHVTHMLEGHADFIIKGEPESAALRLAAGERLSGHVDSPAIMQLDTLPFPRWDLVSTKKFGHSIGYSLKKSRAAFPILSSRSCPEFCTYCPHRITASYRARSPQNVLAEIEEICNQYGESYFIFRDPLFTEEKERSAAIAEGILSRKLPVLFECETRLDDLDKDLVDLLHRAGLRVLTFGVESVHPATLKKVGRRPIPPDHQKAIVSHAASKGIKTVGFYVLGFLTDTVESIDATISYSLELNSSMAAFKILTPYPGTPLRKHMEHLITETDLQSFDGYTPTFQHPNLTSEQLLFMLTTAYSRFYIRPSWGWNYLGLPAGRLANRVKSWDSFAERKQLEIQQNFFATQEPVLPTPQGA